MYTFQIHSGSRYGRFHGCTIDKMVYSNLESLRTSFYASNLRVILFDSVNGEIVRVGWEGSELSCFVDVGISLFPWSKMRYWVSCFRVASLVFRAVLFAITSLREDAASFTTNDPVTVLLCSISCLFNFF
ncbi:hypothetical protein VTN96DRAFT_6476 [Rasamsonia emersonii]